MPSLSRRLALLASNRVERKGRLPHFDRELPEIVRPTLNIVGEDGHDPDLLERNLLRQLLPRLTRQSRRHARRGLRRRSRPVEAAAILSITFVFPTLKGKKDNRQNVRRRLFVTAIERANKKLVKLGIEPIGKVAPHGLRRTFAALRCVAGDDPAYTAAQIGHEDAAFTLRVYTHAVKRRERLSRTELREFNRALEWAQWAQMARSLSNRLRRSTSPRTKKRAICSGLPEWAVLGSNQ